SREREASVTRGVVSVACGVALRGAYVPGSAASRQPSPRSSAAPCGTSRRAGETCLQSCCRLRRRGKFQSASEDTDSSTASNGSREQQSSSTATCSTYPTPDERPDSAPSRSVIPNPERT